MSDHSAIEWTNASWNPVTGCTKLSAGCDFCYAERFAERFRGVPGHPFEPGFDLTLRPERLDQPARWRRSRLIFVNSMSDLFHKNIGADFIGKVFDTVESADWHTYQVLTKRSSLMRDFVNKRYAGESAPGHVWLGVSIENKSALSRLRHLRQTRATVRFVSFEPLLGPIGEVDLSGIHWVIAGGESGPGARPVEKKWLREIRDQCQEQGVAFFFKQWGGRTPKAGGNVLDGRQWLEYPSIGEHNDEWWDNNRLRAAGAPVTEAMDVGEWATEKLTCLCKYLSAYTTILRTKHYRGYFYVDAFAGPGSLRVRRPQSDPAQLSLLELVSHAKEDAEAYIAGSPRAALSIKHPFTDYVFIEKDKERVRELSSLQEQYGKSGPRIHIKNDNCNDYLHGLLERNRRSWHEWRGVVFLDPFGMQVPWKTLVSLAETKAIEVLVNFPVGMAIQRLLPRNGKFTDNARRKLDWYFGTTEWHSLMYEKYMGLFGEDVEKSSGAADKLVKWYRSRLKDIFGHVSVAREVQTQAGRPLYYLIFAGPNRAGVRIANDVLKQGAREVR